MLQKVDILFTTNLSSEAIASLPVYLNITAQSLIEKKYIYTEADIELLNTHSNEQLNCIISSAHTINLLKQILPTATLANWKFWVVGTQTALLTKEYFPQSKIQQVAHSASQLVKNIIAKENITTELFLYPAPLQTSIDMAAELTLHNIACKKISLYQTQSKANTIYKKYDAVAFTSPSNVNSFLKNYVVKPFPNIFFSIGATTSKAIHKAFEKFNISIIESEVPTYKNLLQTITKHYNILTIDA